MRERLIETIQNSVGGCARHWAEVIADGLIDSGVILPILKSGDRVYRVSKNRMWEARIWKVEICGGCISYIDNFDKSFLATHIGKGVFLSREDAEKALKGE